MTIGHDEKILRQANHDHLAEDPSLLESLRCKELGDLNDDLDSLDFEKYFIFNSSDFINIYFNQNKLFIKKESKILWLEWKAAKSWMKRRELPKRKQKQQVNFIKS